MTRWFILRGRNAKTPTPVLPRMGYRALPEPSVTDAQAAREWLQENYSSVYRAPDRERNQPPGAYLVNSDEFNDFRGEPVDVEATDEWEQAARQAARDLLAEEQIRRDS